MAVKELLLLSASEGTPALHVDADSVLRCKLLVRLSAPVADIQVVAALRGSAKGIRIDYGSDFGACSRRVCAHDEWIHDSSEPGRGGGLHEGQHAFDIAIDMPLTHARGVAELPPTFAACFGEAMVSVKYVIKVIVWWSAGQTNASPLVGSSASGSESGRTSGGSSFERTRRSNSIPQISHYLGSPRPAAAEIGTNGLASSQQQQQQQPKRRKEILLPVIVHTPAAQRAALLSNPFPLITGNFGAPGTPRRSNRDRIPDHLYPQLHLTNISPQSPQFPSLFPPHAPSAQLQQPSQLLGLLEQQPTISGHHARDMDEATAAATTWTQFGHDSHPRGRARGRGPGIQCSLTVPRRAVLAGDTLTCTLGCRAAFDKTLTTSKLELIDTLEWDADEYGRMGNKYRPNVLVSVTDNTLAAVTGSADDAGLVGGSWPVQRTMNITVPADAPPTLELGYLSHRFVLRLSITAVSNRGLGGAGVLDSSTMANGLQGSERGGSPTTVVVEMPLLVVPCGIDRLHPRAVPAIPRTVSLSDRSLHDARQRPDETDQDQEQQPSLLDLGLDLSHLAGQSYKIIYSPRPTAADELAVAVGETVQIIEAFTDGWCLVERVTTGARGYVPLTHLVSCQPAHTAAAAAERAVGVGAAASAARRRRQTDFDADLHHTVRHTDLRHLCRDELRFRLLVSLLQDTASVFLDDLVQPPDRAADIPACRSGTDRQRAQVIGPFCTRCSIMKLE
ncbi:hypothetical protein BC831DRAFT_448851 [Entophlyctis helioformis]|nr:hypothetical protein BC831DRAFT_448851 [Entophlyctis helioformis]